MRYCADQEPLGRFFPVVATLHSSFGVYQNIGDILNVANRVRAAPNLQQRIISGRSDVGRIEKQRVREARAPAGGELPVLALDVMDDRRSGPAQQGRNDQPNALAAEIGRASCRERVCTYV